MPWTPELFSAPVRERVEEKWERELETVPFFDGLLAGEFDAPVGSFAGEPKHPDKVAITIAGEKLEPAPGQSVISHGPERNLSVDEIAGIQLVEDAAGAEA